MTISREKNVLQSLHRLVVTAEYLLKVTVIFFYCDLHRVKNGRHAGAPGAGGTHTEVLGGSPRPLPARECQDLAHKECQEGDPTLFYLM